MYTFGHLDHKVKVSPSATNFWSLESSDLLILTCTNATARVLNNASIFNMNPERIESMEFFRRSYVKSLVYLMMIY